MFDPYQIESYQKHDPSGVDPHYFHAFTNYFIILVKINPAKNKAYRYYISNKFSLLYQSNNSQKINMK